MKKLFLLTFIIFYCHLSFSQDTLVLKTGDFQIVKITEVGTDEVKYKQLDNLEGPIFVIKKSDLKEINYSTGTKEVIPASYVATNFGKEENMFAKGQSDAMKYYRGYRPAGTTTLITTILFTPAGLIPAIACGSTRPQSQNLGYPNSELFKNTDYSNGYREKARRMKSNKVWSNFGIGFGVSLALTLLLLSGQ